MSYSRSTYLFFCMILTVISSVFGQEKRTVYPVDFNTDQKEFSPVYFQDGIVFCGVGLQNTAITFVDESGKGRWQF